MTMQVQITKIGNQAAIILSEEMLEKLGINVGEQVEVSTINSFSESNPIVEKSETRRLLVKKLTREIFNEHREALTVLAEGAK